MLLISPTGNDKRLIVDQHQLSCILFGGIYLTAIENYRGSKAGYTILDQGSFFLKMVDQMFTKSKVF